MVVFMSPKLRAFQKVNIEIALYQRSNYKPIPQRVEHSVECKQEKKAIILDLFQSVFN